MSCQHCKRNKREEKAESIMEGASLLTRPRGVAEWHEICAASEWLGVSLDSWGQSTASLGRQLITKVCKKHGCTAGGALAHIEDAFHQRESDKRDALLAADGKPRD